MGRINVLLDEPSAHAPERLKASETAAGWEARARELAAGPTDLAEVAEVREVMDSLRPDTPSP